MGNRKGFQLIELLIVLGFVAIIIGITVSIGFRAVKNAGYSGAVNKLLAEFAFVKQLAARENRYVLFEFNDDGYRYSIRKQAKISETNMSDNTKTLLVRSGSFYEQGKYNNNEFFALGKSSEYSFVVNSMGMVYKKSDIYSLVSNPVPSSIVIPVYFKNDDGSFGAMDTITIKPSGGVNVKTTKVI